MDESPPSVQRHAIDELTRMGVRIKCSVRVVDHTTSPSSQAELTLSDGSQLIADFYVPTFGLIPNSSYIPSKFLTDTGYVIVDDFLKVKGAEDVWALGDVADMEWKQFISTDKQSSYVANNIASVLNNKATVPYKPITRRTFYLFHDASPGTNQRLQVYLGCHWVERQALDPLVPSRCLVSLLRMLGRICSPRT